MLALRLARGAQPLVQLRRLLVAAASGGTGFLLLCTLGYALTHPDASAASVLRLAWCVVPLAATVYFAVAVARTDPCTRPRPGLAAIGLGPGRLMAVSAVTTALSTTLGSLLALLCFLHLRGDLTGMPFDGAAAEFLGADQSLPLPAALTLLTLVPIAACVSVAVVLRPRGGKPPHAGWSYGRTWIAARQGALGIAAGHGARGAGRYAEGGRGSSSAAGRAGAAAVHEDSGAYGDPDAPGAPGTHDGSDAIGGTAAHTGANGDSTAHARGDAHRNPRAHDRAGSHGDATAHAHRNQRAHDRSRAHRNAAGHDDARRDAAALDHSDADLDPAAGERPDFHWTAEAYASGETDRNQGAHADSAAHHHRNAPTHDDARRDAPTHDDAHLDAAAHERPDFHWTAEAYASGETDRNQGAHADSAAHLHRNAATHDHSDAVGRAHRGARPNPVDYGHFGAPTPYDRFDAPGSPAHPDHLGRGPAAELDPRQLPPPESTPSGLPWGAAALAAGLAVETYASRSGPAASGLALPGGFVGGPVGVLAGWVLTAVGLALAGPAITYLCGRLLQAVRPGALRLLAGRVLQAESRRIGQPLGVVCAVASGGYAMATLYAGARPDFGPLTTLGALLVAGCTLLTLATAAVEAKQARADTTAALLRLGAPATLLRSAAALRVGALLALFAPLTWAVAELAALPLVH